MTDVLHVLGTILVLLGALVFATAALGILRFPDAYMRVSAVGTAGGLGILLVIVGALLIQPSVPNLVKVLAIAIIQLLTSAVGTMAIARSAYLTRTPMRRYAYDELASGQESSSDRSEPTSQP